MVHMENTGLFNKDGKELSIIEALSMLPAESVNRIEVIDDKGRSYMNWRSTNIVNLSLQDNCRTLKIFIMDKSKL